MFSDGENRRRNQIDEFVERRRSNFTNRFQTFGHASEHDGKGVKSAEEHDDVRRCSSVLLLRQTRSSGNISFVDILRVDRSPEEIQTRTETKFVQRETGATASNNKRRTFVVASRNRT